MTVKSTVSFTDRHHEFAYKKVKDGSFASVSSIVANSIEQMMQDEAEREAALEAMKNTIKQRMETPREEWIEMNASDDLFAKAKARLNSLK
jgi:antitoxin ParD1/3/4